MALKDIALCIVTVDRSPNENYLLRTLNNLDRAGLWHSNRLHSVHIADSGPVLEPHKWPWPALREYADRFTHPNESIASWPLKVHSAEVRVSGKQNCANALIAGAECGSDWVVQIEDDLDFCDDFIGSVGRWLDLHERPDTVHTFAGDHAMIAASIKKGVYAWDEPVHWFWGNQCLAMRPAVAMDVGMWLREHPIYYHADGRPDENAHDFELQRWAVARGVTHFRASAPCFVQHIGSVTSVPGNPRGGRLVQFPSWPGRAWSFR